MMMKNSMTMTKFVAALLLLTANLAFAEPVTTFQGTDGRIKTKIFEVDGPWELEWDFQGTGLRVEVYHADTSRAVGNPIRQAGTGKGQMNFQKPGPYYLEIKSVGNYTIDVLESSTSELPVYSGGTERKGTPIFTVPEGWGYRWTFEGAAMKLTLFDKNRNQIGNPVSQIGGGSGQRVVGKAGKYFMMIQSSGNYRIELFQQ